MARRWSKFRKTPQARALWVGTIGLALCGPIAALVGFGLKGGGSWTDGQFGFANYAAYFSVISLFCLPLLHIVSFVLASLSDRLTRRNRFVAWAGGILYACAVAALSVQLFVALACADGFTCNDQNPYIPLFYAFVPIFGAGIAFGEWSYRMHQKRESIELFQVFFCKEDAISSEGQLSVTSEGELSLRKKS